MVTQLAEGAEGKVTVGAVTHVAVAVLNHWMLTQPSWAVDHVHHHRQSGLQQEFLIALVLFFCHQLLDLRQKSALNKV